MKKMVAVMLLAGAMFSGAALANIKIAYVDVRQVLVESNAGKQFQSTTEKAGREKQNLFAAEEKKLQSLKAAYEKDQLTLSEAQKRSKQRELQDKYQALQNSVNDTQKEFRQRETEFTSRALKDIRAAITEVAKEEKVTLVLEKTEMSVLYAEDGLDLTAKVLQKFNAKFPPK